MKRASVFAAFFLSGSLAAAAGDSSRLYEVRGLVVDQSRNAVVSALVSLEGTDIAAETDAQGAFVLEDIPAGRYVLSVRSACLVTGVVSPLTVPRPLRVPLPIIAYRWNETPETLTPPLSEHEQRSLLAEVLRLVVPSDKRPILEAFALDGAVSVRVENGTIDGLELSPGRRLPLARGPRSMEAVAPIEIRLAFARPDSATVIVRMSVDGNDDSTPPITMAERALLTFRPKETRWAVVQQLFCSSPPAAAAPSEGAMAPGDEQDP